LISSHHLSRLNWLETNHSIIESPFTLHPSPFTVHRFLFSCAYPVWFTQRWLTLSTAAANLRLAEVAKRAGISLPRMSQIQTGIERGKLVRPLKGLWLSAVAIK
jgi:hypothetical protein